MKYDIITTIKETEKSSVVLALMEGWEDPVIVKRLQNANTEIYRVLSELDNIHLPRIYALEQQEDALLVAEEYVDGETLKSYLEQSLLNEEQKLSVALQLCEAVELLHKCTPPVIHRDIKPSNVVITEEGIVKLIDFDASRQYREERDAEDTRVLGTAQYAAPEQYGFRQTDVRSDIYSLGIVLKGMDFHGRRLANGLWKRITAGCTRFEPKKRYRSVKIVAKKIWRVMMRQKYEGWYWCGAAFFLTVLILTGGIIMHRRLEQKEIPQLKQLQLDGLLVTTPETTQASAPTPTLTPTPTNTPVPAPTNILTPTSLPTPDPERMEAVSQELEEARLTVINYYQSQKEEPEFLLYATHFETATNIVYVTLTNRITEEEIIVSTKDYRLENSVLHVEAELLQSLQNAYYRMEVASEGDRSVTMGIYLRVHSPEEKFVEGEQAIQSNYLDYEYERYEKLHVVLRCDTKAKIVGLNSSPIEAVPPEQYRILCDGRVLELSPELLERCKNYGALIFYVVLDNGVKEKLTINNPYQ